MRSILFIITFTLTFGLQAETLQNMEKACSADKSESCKNLGLFYQIGQNVKKNYEKAKNYYVQACDLNNSEGCRMLGDLYYYGQGVDQNDSKAEQYYDRSCSLNNKKGCNSLQNLLNPNKALKEELERLKQEQEQLIQEAEVLDNI